MGPKKKVGLHRRMRPSATPETDEATDTRIFIECIVYLTADKVFQLCPLLPRGRNAGLLDLLQERRIFHLTQRRRLQAVMFQMAPHLEPQRIYLFALVREGKF